ncbi:MAG: DedA family protein [Acidobacteria bacterium]|nr:DedA family protein [Acidobacteriota bacterium]
MRSLIDFVLHIDTHLAEFVAAYGAWVYGLLFAIVFAETGLVVTPFLPGDSLLFATGALAAAGVLNPWIAGLLLLAAAIAGDGVNYAIGRYIGPRAFAATDTSGLSHKLLNREHLARAHAFFERYGGKAVVLGRFVPIVRTFVPFVAGAGEMTYPAFLTYNVTGAIAWVGVCMGAGLLFGNIPVVREHFSLITLGIVFVSILPMAIEIARHSGQRGQSRVPDR